MAISGLGTSDAGGAIGDGAAAFVACGIEGGADDGMAVFDELGDAPTAGVTGLATDFGTGVIGVFLVPAAGAVGFGAVGAVDCEEVDFPGVEDFPATGGVSDVFVVLGACVVGDLVPPVGGAMRVAG